MGDGFYRSKDPANSRPIKVPKEEGTNSTQTKQTYNKQDMT